jgi:hypothetical protein
MEHPGAHAPCLLFSQCECVGWPDLHRRSWGRSSPGPAIRPGVGCVEHSRPYIDQQKVRCFFRVGRVPVCGGRARGQLERGALRGGCEHVDGRGEHARGKVLLWCRHLQIRGPGRGAGPLRLTYRQGLQSTPLSPCDGWTHTQTRTHTSFSSLSTSSHSHSLFYPSLTLTFSHT